MVQYYAYLLAQLYIIVGTYEMCQLCNRASDDTQRLETIIKRRSIRHPEQSVHEHIF